MTQGHVLAVDDNRVNRIALSRLLRQLGLSVTLAENGQEALEQLKQRPFDLLLLDIIMPEMDGYEVLRRLKQDRQLRDIPVIVISAIDDMKSVVKCIEMGAEDYLPKPFDPVLLRARIGASLEKKRLRDQEQEYLRQLQIEREKAEKLLLNILPRPVAERLKAGQTVIADSFSDVTVLFADIVSFTRLSTNMSPRKLVVMLNEVFSAFDECTLRFGLEKIKTVGDEYMAVGGLPIARNDHAEAIAHLALCMQERYQRVQLELAGLDLRKVEDVVDQPEQRLAAAARDLGEAALLVVELGLEQQPRHADDRVHRGADLVAHGGEELGLGRVREVRAGAGAGQLVDRALESL